MNSSLILIGITIILAIVLTVAFVVKKYRFYRSMYTFYENRWEGLIEKNRHLKIEIDNLKRENKKAQKGIENLTKAIEYQTDPEHKKLLYIHEDKWKQKFVIMFLEELEHPYELQQELAEKRIAPTKHSRELKCTVFIDGQVRYPLLMGKLFRDFKKIELEDINCLEYKNRGIGTLIIQSLVEVLETMGVHEVYAKISTVDYDVRDKLYNFYCTKNGFHLVKEVTGNSRGKVSRQVVDTK